MPENIGLIVAETSRPPGCAVMQYIYCMTVHWRVRGMTQPLMKKNVL